MKMFIEILFSCKASQLTADEDDRRTVASDVTEQSELDDPVMLNSIHNLEID